METNYYFEGTRQLFHGNEIIKCPIVPPRPALYKMWAVIYLLFRSYEIGISFPRNSISRERNNKKTTHVLSRAGHRWNT